MAVIKEREQAVAPTGSEFAVGPRTKERLIELDVARGFALLGIVLVNVDFFAVPFGALQLGGPFERGTLPLAAWVAVSIFCTGKFYSLFALLFGMGAVLQQSSVEGRGGSYTAIGFRRMVGLALIGLLHAFALWYGDILFMYGTAGLVLVFTVRWRPRSLWIAGALVTVAALLLVAGVSVLVPAGAVGDPIVLLEESRSEAMVSAVAQNPFRTAIEQLPDLEGDFSSPLFLAAEAQATRSGPLLDALGFRGVSWLLMVLTGIAGGWWIVLGLFFFGAGLMRWGLFEPERETWFTRFLVLAMAVGLPLSAGSVLMQRSASPALQSLGMVLPVLVGPIMALGYLSAWVIVVRAGWLRPLTRALAATGRLALTNYLTQSVVLGAVFYHWGLGRFGSMPGHQRVLLALSIFLVQLVVSSWWVRRFHFGPIEWLWRWVTYGRRPILRRKAAGVR